LITAFYPLSLHDALPISCFLRWNGGRKCHPYCLFGAAHEIARPESQYAEHGEIDEGATRDDREQGGDAQHRMAAQRGPVELRLADRKSTRLNSSHQIISY